MARSDQTARLFASFSPFFFQIKKKGNTKNKVCFYYIPFDTKSLPKQKNHGSEIKTNYFLSAIAAFAFAAILAAVRPYASRSAGTLPDLP